MKRILVFDCESNGFPRKDLSSKHSLQACIVQIAAILYDEEFNKLEELYSLLKLPEGKSISEGAFGAHGLSKEKCNTEGNDSFCVLQEFDAMYKQADIVVAHNYQFDSTMAGIWYGSHDMTFFNKDSFCTMEYMTDICKLPFPNGKKRFGQKNKWPKLMEAYKHCFGKEFEGAHDALVDVKACAEIYRCIQTQTKPQDNIVELPLA